MSNIVETVNNCARILERAKLDDVSPELFARGKELSVLGASMEESQGVLNASANKDLVKSTMFVFKELASDKKTLEAVYKNTNKAGMGYVSATKPAIDDYIYTVENASEKLNELVKGNCPVSEDNRGDNDLNKSLDSSKDMTKS